MPGERTATRLLAGAAAAALMVKALHYAFATLAARKRKLVVETLRALPGAALCGAEAGGRLAAALGPRDVTSLHVVFDFDRTLTAHDAHQCHDPLLRLDDPQLQAALAPYWRFAEEGGPPPCRGRAFRCWWDDVHALLVTHRVTMAQLRAAEALKPCFLRAGAWEALAKLVELRVPTTVVSAGLEHTIVGTLETAGIASVSFLDDDLADARAPARVRVLANRLVTVDGVVTGALPAEPVHAQNKRDAHARLAPWFAASAAGATRLVVFGDSVGDAAVAAPVPAAAKARVGFFDPANPWGKRAAFEAAFDCLLPHDASLGWLADHLGGCKTTR